MQRLEDSRVVDRSAPRAAPLLVCDFDQTLLDYDSLGRLIGLMAPDLLRMWMSVKQPQNFIPMTNAIFGALQRRGITAGAIERTLLKMGRIEFPRQSAELLRDAHTRGVKVVVLSDCNDWLIQLLLRAAGCATYVSAIITNTALFTHASHFDDTTPPPASASRDLADPSLRLAVFPRHPWDKPPHGCPYCPANLCKGAELSALRSANPTAPVVYCGDGANDYCPALRLAEGDTVLARKGFALDTLIQQSMGDAVCRGSALGGLGPFRADIRSWTDHEDLRGMVEDLIDAWAAEVRGEGVVDPVRCTHGISVVDGQVSCALWLARCRGWYRGSNGAQRPKWSLRTLVSRVRRGRSGNSASPLRAKTSFCQGSPPRFPFLAEGRAPRASAWGAQWASTPGQMSGQARGPAQTGCDRHGGQFCVALLRWPVRKHFERIACHLTAPQRGSFGMHLVMHPLPSVKHRTVEAYCGRTTERQAATRKPVDAIDQVCSCGVLCRF